MTKKKTERSGKEKKAQGANDKRKIKKRMNKKRREKMQRRKKKTLSFSERDNPLDFLPFFFCFERCLETRLAT